MSNDDKLSIAEMLAFFDVERTKFSERVFSIFDDDKRWVGSSVAAPCPLHVTCATHPVILNLLQR